MATMKTLNGYGFDSAKLGGRAPEYYTNPRNLLYNSDFTNPVNQRGETTYNAGGYTIDGWSIWSVNGDASLTLVEGGIAFNPGTGSGTFTQKLPLGLLDSAKTYTLAVHKSNGETQVKTDGVTFNHNGNGDLITISTVQETIVWAALYEGSYTVDNVPPPFFYPQRLEMLNLGLPVQPRNLFDNSDFRKPVNQRGYTEITGDWNYGIDRWLVSTKYEQNPNGSILITDNGLSMGYWTDMMQLIPFEQIKGKTLTFAVCTENGVYAYTMTLPESAPPAGSGSTFIGDGIWNNIIVMESIKYDNNDSVMFRFRNAQTTNQLVYWSALYEGSYTVDTLPPYVPKGYAAELAACNSAPVDVGGGYGGGSLQAYPVGSIYMSVNSTSPASLFGGTWEQLQDRFLLAAGSTYSAGSMGGEAEHSLIVNELPKIEGWIEAGAGSSGTPTSGGHGAFRSASGVFSVTRNCHYSYDNSDKAVWTPTDTDSWQQVNISFGNDQPHNNMPPYLAVYMWKRVS